MDRQEGLLPIALAAATDFEVRQIKRALGSSLGSSTGSSRGSSTSSSIGSSLDSVAFTVVPVGVSCRELSVDELGKSCSAIVSIGFAGALNPALQPGTCLAPTLIVTSDQNSFKVDPDLHEMIAAQVLPCVHDAPLLHTPRLLSSVTDKQQAFKDSNCSSCDMESGILAELAQSLAIPFACVRVVLDPATAPLPHCIAGFADPEWTTADFLLANLRRPREIPATAAILKHTVIASRALRQVTRALAKRSVA